jgi:hypothetical protein
VGVTASESGEARAKGAIADAVLGTRIHGSACVLQVIGSVLSFEKLPRYFNGNGWRENRRPSAKKAEKVIGDALGVGLRFRAYSVRAR